MKHKIIKLFQSKSYPVSTKDVYLVEEVALIISQFPEILALKIYHEPLKIIKLYFFLFITLEFFWDFSLFFLSSKEQAALLFVLSPNSSLQLLSILRPKY